MDYTELLDYIADQIDLAVPCYVLYWARQSYLPDLPRALWDKHHNFRYLPESTQNRAVHEWFAAIEPGEPSMVPWSGPYPTDGF